MKSNIHPDEIPAILERELANFETPLTFQEVGSVLRISDGVVQIYGLTHARLGEIITFVDGSQGLILTLKESHVGAIVLSSTHSIKEGDSVQRTGSLSSVQVTESLIGRVVDTFAQPIDGKGTLQGPFFTMPTKRQAPGVIHRNPVTTPLQTGIKAIDAMIPIGRGQRELIIGDRQTGKTTIALDTIINQRAHYEEGTPVYCIYVAIGQKKSTVSHLVALLRRCGAMDYTTVVVAPADVPASQQYLAPFVGTAIAEYFRDSGRHALVVYDDLSKHAVAYREIALSLGRTPGREAYPGDIFYQHAQLLERAAQITPSDSLARQMNDLPATLQGKVKGGGSLTALPIIETQAGDIAAYIPTNVISITDGQIFLDSDLFNSGTKPAIDVGISVSRVGGAAQRKSMQRLAGTLKLAQAHFQELETFAKFGAELDPATQRIIDRGRKNRELLKQLPYQPLPFALQIALLYVAVHNLLDPLPSTSVTHFEEAYRHILTADHSDMLATITQGHPLNEATQATLSQIAQEVIKDILQSLP